LRKWRQSKEFQPLDQEETTHASKREKKSGELVERTRKRRGRTRGKSWRSLELWEVSSSQKPINVTAALVDVVGKRFLM